VTEMVRSLIDTYRHLGWLPDCRMSLNKGYTQVTTTLQDVSPPPRLLTLPGWVQR
jgi:putative alpha-1,2-mannosidase